MKPRILFVDDESHVLESLADVWGYDYDVATAADGASGLAMIAAWNPAVIVSDMRMPGMDGAAFLAAARALAPTTVRLLLTGQADLEAAGRAVNVGGIFKLLTKPCPHDLLDVALGEAIALHAQQIHASQLSSQMAHVEQLATLGTMSAVMGHEITNSLTLLNCAIESVEEDAAMARVPDVVTVQQLVRGRDRLIAHARGATALSRRSEHLLEVLELGEVLGSLVEAIHTAGLAKRAELVLAVEDAAAVIADRTELDQVMLNLIKNALDALPEGRGRVEVAVRRRGGNAEVTIHDTGSGIATADLAKVFEPYFTTKPPTVGTGLGLPVAKQLITAYGGTIGIASRVGIGTRVTIELPIVVLNPIPARRAADTLAP